MSLIYGLFGLIIFVLDVWAIASVINSNAERNTKIIWVIIIAVLPVAGLIAWWFVGPKANY
ncbi:MAG: PLD nuclease N-terminal domain-containing protein [Paracoccus sp. (in: a-proteobacteria)]|nr:PLD nuclease N-terminal domain-containing protein [Paracoccus sp. (in: a-proteobacteria)]